MLIITKITCVTIITMSIGNHFDVIVRHSLYGLSMRMLVCMPVTCAVIRVNFSPYYYHYDVVFRAEKDSQKSQNSGSGTNRVLRKCWIFFSKLLQDVAMIWIM